MDWATWSLFGPECRAEGAQAEGAKAGAPWDAKATPAEPSNVRPTRNAFRQAFHGSEFRLLALLGCLGPWRLRHPSPAESLRKVVVYVPRAYLGDVRAAMAKAGAGHIGLYSECTFATFGYGTFRPGPFADPFLGGRGELAEVEEARLETVVAASLLSEVLAAMLRAHPYEEVAYDVYRLENPQQLYGHGREVRQKASVAAEDLAVRLTEKGIGVRRVHRKRATSVLVDLTGPLGDEAGVVSIGIQGDPDILLEERDLARWEEEELGRALAELGLPLPPRFWEE